MEGGTNVVKWDVSNVKSLPLWAIKTEVIAMVPYPLCSPPWGPDGHRSG